MNITNNLLLSNDGKKKNVFRKIEIQSGTNFDEKWLQKVIYENIELLSVADSAFEKIKLIPLCREFSLNNSYRNIFLDILAITETGKLVLVECKLWKNPQARREVVAQIIEYSSLMRKLSYSDLTAYLHKYIKTENSDPIQHQLKDYGIDVNESLMIDRVSESLKKGDFYLIIAGDGIRSDVQSMTETLTIGNSFLGNLSLIELPIFEDENGDILITPRVPFRTETITKTIYFSPEGEHASIEDDSEEIAGANSVGKKYDSELVKTNRKFWEEFITNCKFEHPDQSAPRHGGRNWIRIDFPSPIKWVSAYRYLAGSYIGISARATGEEAKNIFEYLNERKTYLLGELGDDIFLTFDDDSKEMKLGGKMDIQVEDPSTFKKQNDWFQEKLNKFSNTLRPILKEYSAVNNK